MDNREGYECVGLDGRNSGQQGVWMPTNMGVWRGRAGCEHLMNTLVGPTDLRLSVDGQQMAKSVIWPEASRCI